MVDFIFVSAFTHFAGQCRQSLKWLFLTFHFPPLTAKFPGLDPTFERTKADNEEWAGTSSSDVPAV
jgi:hypothetical protein